MRIFITITEPKKALGEELNPNKIYHWFWRIAHTVAVSFECFFQAIQAT